MPSVLPGEVVDEVTEDIVVVDVSIVVVVVKEDVSLVDADGEDDDDVIEVTSVVSAVLDESVVSVVDD